MSSTRTKIYFGILVCIGFILPSSLARACTDCAGAYQVCSSSYEECLTYDQECDAYSDECTGYSSVCDGYDDYGNCVSYSDVCDGDIEVCDSYTEVCGAYQTICTSYTTECSGYYYEDTISASGNVTSAASGQILAGQPVSIIDNESSATSNYKTDSSGNFSGSLLAQDDANGKLDVQVCAGDGVYYNQKCTTILRPDTCSEPNVSGVNLALVPVVPPPVPTQLKLTSSSPFSLNAAWTSGGGTTSTFLVNVLPGNNPALTCTGGAASASNSYVISSLVANTLYTVAVCSVNAKGLPSSTSVVSTGTTQALPPLLFGAPSALSFNKNYTASSDGFVVASAWTGNCQPSGTGYSFQDVIGSTGSSSSNLKAIAYNADWDVWRATSITFPVVNGQTYSVASYCTDSASSGKAQFIPTTKSIFSGGSPQAKTLGTSYQAPSDSFVVGSGWTGACNGTGSSQPYQTMSIESSFWNISSLFTVGAGWGPWRAENVFMPVSQNSTYQVSAYCNDSASNDSLMAVAASNGLGKVQSKSFNSVYQAESNGFIFANGWTGLCTSSPGQYFQGFAGSASTLGNSNLMAFKMAWGPYRNITISYPVTAGQYYEVSAMCQDSYSGATMAFVPYNP